MDARNQMQTGIRQNHKHLFKQGFESRVIRNHKVHNRKAEESFSVSNCQKPGIRISSKQTGTRQNQNQNQRGVEYNLTINWLTQNLHRITINALMV